MAKPVIIGSIFGDALGAVLSPIVDVFTSVVDRIPGGEWVRTAISDGAGEIGDFAKTPVGFSVLSVISGGLVQASIYLPTVVAAGSAIPTVTTAIAAGVGTGAAQIAIATPGLIAGDDFTTAYARGLTDYLLKGAIVATGGAAAPAATAAATAAQLGLSPAVGAAAAGTAGAVAAAAAAGKGGGEIMGSVVGPIIKDQLAVLVNSAPFQDAMHAVTEEIKKTGISIPDAIDKLGMKPGRVADKFGVRPDVAALAENAVLHTLAGANVPVHDLVNFDPITGLPIPRTPAQIQKEISTQEQLIAAYGEGEAARFGGGQKRLNALKQELSDVVTRTGLQPPAAETPRPLIVQPPAIGYVRVVHDPIPLSKRAKELGRLALLTSPLWGYVWLRHRGTLP